MDYTKQERFRYLILALQRHGNRDFNHRLKAIDLTPSQAEVIHLLQLHPSITLKELGAMLICETGSPSRLVNAMMDKKLVQNTADVTDKRANRYFLTAYGMQQYTNVTAIEQDMYQRLETIYTNEELDQLNHLLVKYISNTDMLSLFKKRDMYE